MRKLLIACAISALVSAQSIAYAENGCFGCNVYDTGQFDSGLIGRSVYVEGGVGAWATVRDIDSYNGNVFVELSNGQSGWVSSSNVYTSTARDERNGATAVGVVAGAALLACLMGACNSSSSGNSYGSSSSSGGSNAYDYDELNRRNQSPPPPPPPPPPSRSYGLYGDCPQPGAGYGC